MLWVNLIMDTFASLALATEPPKEELLKRKPYGRNENLITPVMGRNVLGQSAYQILCLIIILWKGDVIFGVPSGRMNPEWTLVNGVHYTILFNSFVFLQAFNEINARKLKTEEVNVFEDFMNNPMFLFIEILTIIVQVIFVEVGGKALHCSPLTFNQHLICILIGAGSLFVGVIIKKLPDSIFSTIPLLDRQITIDKLRGTAGSLRKDPSLKYKTQGSMRK
jgi:P-type Ca2+ transporter type 2B